MKKEVFESTKIWSPITNFKYIMTDIFKAGRGKRR